jgi:ribonuclease PH
MSGGDLLTDSLCRADGRLPGDIRPLSVRLGVYAHADGSAIVQMGGTRVLCAVYGPHECRHRSRQLNDRAYINCQYSMAAFSTQMRKVLLHFYYPLNRLSAGSSTRRSKIT